MYFIVKGYGSLPSHVINTAIQLVSKITKLEWAHEPNKSIIYQLKQIATLSPAHRTLGLAMYASLVQEMSLNVSDQRVVPVGKQLRVMVRFKSELLDILHTALAALQGCLLTQQGPPGEREAALRLLRAVLSFNFKPFEASDADEFTLYAPDSWAPVLEAPDLQDALLATYFALPSPPCSVLALECLCLVTAARTGVFRGDTRPRFVGRCLGATQRILESGCGLECQANHHMFARLLLAVKTNVRIRELVSDPLWQSWITLVFGFTVKSLQNWMFSPNSIHFLMHFWFKLSLCYDVSLNKVISSNTTTTNNNNTVTGGNSGIAGTATTPVIGESPLSAPASPASLSFFKNSPAKARARRKSFLRQFQQPQTPTSNRFSSTSSTDPDAMIDADTTTTTTTSNNDNNNNCVGTGVVEDQTFITKFAPQIAEEFIKSRVASVQLGLTTGLDDDYLGSEATMSEQLEDIPYIARCDYRTTGLFVVSAFEKAIEALRAGGTTQPAPGTFQSNLLLGQCAWFVYLIGAFVSVRIDRPTRDENDTLDEIDGELASRVLFLMRLTEARIPAVPETIRNDTASMETALEVAYSYFLFHLRRSYIRDTPYSAAVASSSSSSSSMYTPSSSATAGAAARRGPPKSKFFGALEKNLGLKSVTDVFDVMFRKIASNLKWFRGNDMVVEKTLSAFHELATGYSSQRAVAQLPIVAEFLANHTAVFPLEPGLSGDAAARRCKHCVTLYSTLGRLVLADNTTTTTNTSNGSVSAEDRFTAFMTPIGETLETIRALLSHEAAAAQQQQQQQLQLKAASLLCVAQLQGLFESAASRRSYGIFFRWLCPRYLPVLAGLGRLYGSGDLGFYHRLMKLVCEIAWNRSCRISFDVAAPESGLLLFKELCTPTLIEFGAQLQPLLLAAAGGGSSSGGGGNGGDAYSGRYRYVAVCVQTMLNTILGDYIDFGAFVYYKDPCLGKTLGTVLCLLLAVPPDDMVGYEKLFLPAASLLSAVASQFPAALFQLEEAAFGRLLRLLVSGIVAATSPQLITCCCIVLDKLFSAYNDKKKKLASVVFNNGGGSELATAAQHLGDRAAELAASTAAFEHNIASFPDFIESVIRTLFYLSYSAKDKYVYAAAKAIYALTLFAPQKFRDAEAYIVRSQPQESQEKLAGYFASLEKKISSDSECIFAATLKEKFCNLFSNFIDVTCNLIDLNNF